eukprot:5144196-Amphidinium_carterae.1
MGVPTRRIRIVTPDEAERCIYVERDASRLDIEASVSMHMAVHPTWYRFIWSGERVVMLPSNGTPREVPSVLTRLFDAIHDCPLRLSRRRVAADLRTFSAGHRASRARGILKIPDGSLATIVRINRLLRQLLPTCTFDAWTISRFRQVLPHRDVANHPNKDMLILTKA